jgi:hypothetical protein
LRVDLAHQADADQSNGCLRGHSFPAFAAAKVLIT